MLTALLFAITATPPFWNLATDDTQISIGVSHDRPVIVKLSGKEDAFTWCQNSPISLIDHVMVAGLEVDPQWQFVNAAPDERGRSLILTFRSTQAKLILRSIWLTRTGPGPFEHRIEIENRSKSDVQVPKQDSISLEGINPGGKADVWWVRRGASNALVEGGVFNNPVMAGLNLELESNHHDPSSPVPWLSVQVGSQRGLYLGWEFSGLGQVRAKASSPTSLTLSAGLNSNFKTDIGPGETLSIPAAFVGCYKGDLDNGSNHLRKFIVDHLRAKTPPRFADPTMVLGLYLDAGADKATESDVLRCLSFAKGLNLDTFLCDAMWFPACGDWNWDPKRFPRGGRVISDAVHKAGMKFGLWCAWNNGGISDSPGALSVRGPQGHPDWFGHDLPPTWQPGPFYGESADMSCAPAKAWALTKTQSLARDLDLDLMKTDVHPMINECIRTDHRHHYGTDVSYWSTLGVYEVWDKLRKSHPNVVLENCSGASHIKDFGVLQRCAYTATTDTLSNLPDRAGIFDSTYILPPSALMTYTYEQGYGLPGDDPGTFLFRSAMSTAWDLAPTNSKGWSEEQKAEAVASVRTYKEWLRPILKDCEVHHVLPRPNGKRWDGIFLWSPKLLKGTLFAFRPDSRIERQSIVLAGLKPDGLYQIWSDDGSIQPGMRTGAELMSDGVSLYLPSNYSSDLIHIQESGHPLPRQWGTPGEFLAAPVKFDRDYLTSKAQLHWSASKGSRSYRVVVSPNLDMSRPISDAVAYVPTQALTKLTAGKRYYWQVTAMNWGGSRRSHLGTFVAQGTIPWSGAFASEMPWSKAEAGSGEPHRDVNYAGHPLSIAGKVQRKGIWTHAFSDGRPADIDIDIAGKGFDTFRASVGLDDAAGGGSVQFQILRDGKLMSETEVLKPGIIRSLNVSVKNASVITLRVLNGGDGYTSDHAVWGMARFLKSNAKDPVPNQ